MKCGLLFNKHDVALVFGNWVVAHALWNDKHIALSKFNRSIFHLDLQVTFENQKQFILIGMTVPCQ